MKSSRSKSLQVFDEIEHLHSSSGELPTVQSADASLYSALIGEWDGKKAEGLVLTQPVHGLLASRAHILRGNLSSARKAIQTLEPVGQDSSELNLERARLECLEGRWANGLGEARQGLEKNVTPVTRLTLHQIASLAHFELGQMNEALWDLDRIESLGRLYPKSPSLFYSRLLKAKIDGHTISPEAGLILVQSLWRAILSTPNEITADTVVGLLRTEIELLRLKGESPLLQAVATRILTRSNGDRFYEALAALDIYVELSEEQRHLMSSSLARPRDEYQRFATLFDEVEQGKPSTTSARSLRVAAQRQPRSQAQFSDLLQLESASSLIFPSVGLICHLEPWKTTTFDSESQVALAFHLLSDGPVSKENFFETLWGLTYVPDRHDNTIWSVLNRMKKTTGFSPSIRDGHLTFDSALIVPLQTKTKGLSKSK